MKIKADNPYAVKFELVEGCNLMCNFCAIQTIWKDKKDRQIKHMSLELATELVSSLKKWGLYKKRIECAGHGEPTLNPNIIDIFNLIRTELPLSQILLTTNGMTILKKGKKFIEDLFNSGLNIMLIDTYHKRKTIVDICKSLPDDISVFDYYDPAGNSVNPYYYSDPKQKVVFIIEDIAIKNKVKRQRQLANLAGNTIPKLMKEHNVQPIKAPIEKKCFRPFRELYIHWDGTVPLCCWDWRHEFIIGKFPDDGSLEKIWNSEIFNITRDFIINKKRIMRPCYKCDYFGGFRLGLLPKVNVEMEEKKMRNKLERHIKKYSKYTHHSAKEEPFLYNKQQCGISKFLNKK